MKKEKGKNLLHLYLKLTKGKDRNKVSHYFF